jgi:Zn-dependent protease
MRSLRLGRAFGIPLYLHPTFFLLLLMVPLMQGQAGLLAYAFQTVLILAIFACVLLHELGHALMARYFGIRTRDITLYPIGGVARLERMSEKPSEELLVAVAGPAVNVVIAGLLTPLAFFAILGGALGPDGPIVTADQGLLMILGKFVVAVWISNIALVLFNLLPIFPMDGGRVLRSILAMFTTHLKATEISARLGLVMAGALAVLAVVSQHWMLLILAVFIAFAGQQELMMLRYREAQRQAQQALAADPYTAADPYAAYDRAAPAAPVWTGPAWEVPPPVLRDPTFSGVVWDRTWRVWVRWQNGQPVEAYWGHVE